MANKTTDHVMSITVQGREIPIARRMLNLGQLQFYLQNPRVYSIVHQDDGDEPDQQDILDALVKMDHVKQLIQAIRQNGGLTDPLLVREKDLVVLEGNSRLAAYKTLSGRDPIRWGKVKCDVVTVPISDLEVKALLTHYHIIGRKSWDPFEQAGLFWRWHKEGVGMEEILERVEQIGVSAKKIRHWIEVYSMMVEHKDTNPSRWSHYDEYLKNRDVQRARRENPEMDKVIVHKIQTREIAKAVDVRDKVTKIAKAGGRTLKVFLEKKNTLDDCFERAVEKGATDALYNRLNRLRKTVADPGMIHEIEEMNDGLKDKCLFELRQIQRSVERALKKLGKRG